MTSIKFKVDELLPKLTQVAQVVSQKNTIRILDYVMCSTAFDELTITASDNETWLSVKVMVEVIGGGDALFCIEASKLIASLRMLTGETVELELNNNSKIAKGKYANGFFEMPFVDAEEFPISIIDGELQEATVKASELRNLLYQPMFAVSSDDLHPQMTCVRLDFVGENMVSCGTDGHVLVRYTQKNNIGIVDKGISIPNKPANVIVQLISSLDDDATIDIGFNDSKFNVSSKSSFTLSTRLNTMRYPNYNAVIPQNNNIIAKIDKDKLIGALRRVLPFGNAKTASVTCRFTQGNLNVSAKDIDFSTAASENIPCEYDNQEMAIGFNGTQLIEAVKNVTTSENKVVFKMEAPERAAVILPDWVNDEQEYVSMLMPMMID